MFNVVYPSYCDTTVDLYMQAHELMKSSRIAGFCANFCKILWGRTPRPPSLNTSVNLITINTAIDLTLISLYHEFGKLLSILYNTYRMKYCYHIV